MPLDLSTATSLEIIDDLGTNYLGLSGQLHIAELKAREIKSGDSDDNAKVEGGIRPLHAPRV